MLRRRHHRKTVTLMERLATLQYLKNDDCNLKLILVLVTKYKLFAVIMKLNIIRPIEVKNSRFCRIRKHRRHSFLIDDVKMHCRNRQLTTCVPAIGEKDKTENPAMPD